MFASHRHCVAEPEWLALANEVDVGKVGQFDHVGQLVGLPGPVEVVLQLEVAIEVIFEAALVPPRDDEDVVDTGLHGLLDDVLDGRAIDDRQHLLRLGLCRRKEPRPESCRRDARLRYHPFCHGCSSVDHVCPRPNGRQSTAEPSVSPAAPGGTTRNSTHAPSQG